MITSIWVWKIFCSNHMHQFKKVSEIIFLKGKLPPKQKLNKIITITIWKKNIILNQIVWQIQIWHLSAVLKLLIKILKIMFLSVTPELHCLDENFNVMFEFHRQFGSIAYCLCPGVNQRSNCLEIWEDELLT